MGLHLVNLTDTFSCYTSGELEARFIYEEIFKNNDYDVPTLPDAPCIVDAGANIGLFSLYIKAKHPLAKIVAFEPAPETFEALTRNLDLHHVSDVVVYPYALGSRARTATFTYFPRAPGNSTLNGEEKRRQIEWFEENYGGSYVGDMVRDATQMAVPVHRLSYFLSRYHGDVGAIDLLKIDVEGAELEVLGGLDDADWDKVQNVVMEVSDLQGRLDEVKRLLESKGFTVTCGVARGIPEVFNTYIVKAGRRA
ncbi:S-adenosyl-L-methionine-dependent methyltransferase [Aspergillus coremiiformis]|uniref:S-adenosyl-L-methionine-dependent methyltransferase n=1 Tax=Aspergillus coremiiformis TaxID=138285 RepID=A0A5N6Z1N5_9EURO|nr:S-adenosyl-L-methionine-dependent methyltransferase [Aspergillus coremiiformis]